MMDMDMTYDNNHQNSKNYFVPQVQHWNLELRGALNPGHQGGFPQGDSRVPPQEDLPRGDRAPAPAHGLEPGAT